MGSDWFVRITKDNDDEKAIIPGEGEY